MAKSSSLEGPHLGSLKSISDLQIPLKLAEQIESQLQERVLQELELLSERLAASTLRVKNRETPDEFSFTTHSRPVIRRLYAGEVGEPVIGKGIVALLDITGLDDKWRHQNNDVEPKDEDEDVSANKHGDLSTPRYTLSKMFPKDRYAELSRKLRKILNIERTEVQRFQKQRKAITDSSAGVTGPTYEPIPSQILALSTWASSSDDIRAGAGEMGVDLAIALWRLRSWTGQGWEEFEVDRSGKRL